MSMTHDEMCAVIQAHKQGKKIEVARINFGERWQPCAEPAWDFSSSDYRVAPKPPPTDTQRLDWMERRGIAFYDVRGCFGPATRGRIDAAMEKENA